MLVLGVGLALLALGGLAAVRLSWRAAVRALVVLLAALLLPAVAAAQDVVYAFPARPPGWESQLWPALPIAPPADFARKQREQWGDERLDAGALRSSDAGWQVLTGAGWIPYDAVSHTGIVRMYYRYGLHSYRGQVHQEPENQYLQLSQKDPVAWPPIPWIFERTPAFPGERCLEDVGMDRSFRDRVRTAWRAAHPESGGGGTETSSGELHVIPDVLLIEATPEAGEASLVLRVEKTSRANAASVGRLGLPSAIAVSVAPARLDGPGERTVKVSWPAGVALGTYDKAGVVISTGSGPENKRRVPLLFVVKPVGPPPEPEPEPEPPPPTPPPTECPPPPVCRCEAQVTRATGEAVGATVLCLPVQ